RGTTSTSEKDPTGPIEWRAMLPRVRTVFSGAVTYEASWDRVPVRLGPDGPLRASAPEMVASEIAPELDAISVSGTAPLRAGPDGDLTAAARAFVADLGELSRREKKPVLLGEMGYSATADTATTPWRAQGPVDETAQARAWRAIADALRGEDSICGAIVYGLPFDPARSSPAAVFSPLKRPAFAAVRDALAALRCP
ncbi:MAG TPA: hypothetical protein VKE69_08390, partial [Planctomycetota bacterium]|nr:hypothetical protein [Planctomycetota bacterium]